jgi:hypothetical protein
MKDARMGLFCQKRAMYILARQSCKIGAPEARIFAPHDHRLSCGRAAAGDGLKEAFGGSGLA